MTEATPNPSECECPPNVPRPPDERVHVVLDAWTRQKLDDLARGTSLKATLTGLITEAYAARQAFLRRQFNATTRGTTHAQS